MLSVECLPMPIENFFRTKLVAILPRYVIINRTSEKLMIKQKGDGGRVVEVYPGDRGPFYPLDLNGDGQLEDDENSVSFSTASSAWSPYFRVDLLRKHCLYVEPSRVTKCVRCAQL